MLNREGFEVGPGTSPRARALDEFVTAGLVQIDPGLWSGSPQH